MLLSNSVKVNKKTIEIRWMCFLSWFDFLPEVYLWFRLWQYHYSNKQTVKCTCITLYTYTAHCTMRTRSQSVRRQHEKRTSEQNEMVTCEDILKLPEICDCDLSKIKPLGRMVHNMLKLLVIFQLNKLALCLLKGQLFFKVIKRNYNMAANKIFRY